MENDAKRPPRAFRLDPQPRPQAKTTMAAEPLPRVIEPEQDAYEREAEAMMASLGSQDGGEAAVEKAQAEGMLPSLVRRALLSWGGVFWTALAALASLTFGLWLDRLVEDLYARAPSLGIVGLVLVGLMVSALVALATRELVSVIRQRQIAVLHLDLARAREADDADAARRLVLELNVLYKNRTETAQARVHLEDLTKEIVDGRDLIDIAERTLIEPIDAKVRQEIANAAKRVSVVTTFAPRAILDVLFVAGQSLSLIRTIAALYGGRPGLVGFLKLLRSVGAHLAITGSMAAGDTILQQFVGHGIAAKVSARLGEGVLNGLLTARVGLSAMAVCRPMPFAEKRAPSVGDVAPFLFTSPKEEKT
ncbi:YcjF family protein [Beijerinckia indica]|uniref:TIGR01620 family protein n=1 Tax=Beijerinckia indica subsp. indica (strain ATCC 9039 / DSM 1715 / NCIMB 8712) TaxID=395963 RepID=B2IHX9_BEII9|nr:TIGR01620 family protein [Beijerinckia indica]ACB96022.1 conserved hypothetical protein [Beijerinckia indica subsp. indica ATCC 9039]